jgi:hypothetical protein
VNRKIITNFISYNVSGVLWLCFLAVLYAYLRHAYSYYSMHLGHITASVYMHNTESQSISIYHTKVSLNIEEWLFHVPLFFMRPGKNWAAHAQVVIQSDAYVSNNLPSMRTRKWIQHLDLGHLERHRSTIWQKQKPFTSVSQAIYSIQCIL